MSKTLIAISGLVLLALTGFAGAFVTGLGPAPGGTNDDVESFPTETSTAESTASSDGDGSTTDSSTATDSSTPAFGFGIERIEKCGRTCRDVTSTLTNQQATSADSVTVSTRLYIGNGTDGDVAWEGSETVGTLEAGESYTATRRVELSYSEAFAVEQHGGWVTVQTTVRTDAQTMTFTEQRHVA